MRVVRELWTDPRVTLWVTVFAAIMFGNADFFSWVGLAWALLGVFFHARTLDLME